jgi:alkylation response protein AidB-like acyl-CoA dehydrogenase
LQQRLLRLEAEAMALRDMGRRALEDIMQDRPLGSVASVMKLAGSNLMQALEEVGLDATGRRLAFRFRDLDDGTSNTADPGNGRSAEPGIEWLQNFLYGRVRTIYGGSNEVQKNLLARSLFGN